MITIQFNDEIDKENILNTHISNGYFLMEEQRLFNGNFLVFDIKPREIILTMEERMTSIEQAINEILMGGI